jgi:hypothetical protein
VKKGTTKGSNSFFLGIIGFRFGVGFGFRFGVGFRFRFEVG